MSDLEIINRFINHEDRTVRSVSRRVFDAMCLARTPQEITAVRGWCLPADLHLALSSFERVASLNNKGEQ